MLALCILLFVLTRLPYVQAKMGNFLESAIGKKLGTEIRIGSVDIGFPNRIIIDSLTVLDKQNKQMLGVGRLSAKIDLTGFLENRISISSAQLFNAHASLYRKDSLSAPNFQFVLDSLASKDTLNHTSVDLRINSLIIRNSSVSYDELDVAQTPNRLNVRHLRVTDISAHIILKAITEDSLNVNLKRLTLREQSGLHIKRLAVRTEAGRHNAKISNFLLQLPRSSIEAGDLLATYDADKFKETLSYDGSIKESTLTPGDFAPLLPLLQHHNKPLSLSTVFYGSSRTVSVPKLNIASVDHYLMTEAQGYADFTNRYPVWQARISQLDISEQLIAQVCHDMPKIPEIIGRLGSVSLSGGFEGMTNGLTKTSILMNTDAGNLELNGQLWPTLLFEGHMKTEQSDLQRLLADDRFGKMSAQLSFKGSDKTVNAKGHVEQIDFQGYSYQNIKADISYSSGQIAALIDIDDPNVKSVLNGQLQKKGKMFTVKMEGKVDNIAPKKLNLTDQWGDAVFSSHVNADLTASNLHDAQGTVDISNFQMADSADNYRVKNIKIKTGYDDSEHFFELRGDMGEVRIRGSFDWPTIHSSFISHIISRLPTLPGINGKDLKCNNHFDAHVYLSDTQWMQRILNIPFIIKDPIILNARVDDERHQLNIAGSMPSFTYNGNHYYNGNISIKSPDDSTRCIMALTKEMDDGRLMKTELQATAAGNKLQTCMKWDNNAAEEFHMKGQLNAITQLYHNTEAKPEAFVQILPSHVKMRGTEWEVKPSDITYCDRHLEVDHFTITNGLQHLTVNGKLTDTTEDILSIDLEDVEVGYVLDLVNFHSVEFSGSASGQAFVCGAFNTPQAWTDLKVKNFHFEGGRMGTLYAKAQWNQAKEQIDIDAISDDGDDAKTIINGYVSPPRNFIDLAIHGQGTYIEFLNSFTNSFLSNLTGHAEGDVRLAGDLDDMNLTGQLVVSGQAKVNALNTTYYLKNDTVKLIPDDILLSRIPIYDAQENMAFMSGGIHHRHLTSLTFDLDIETQRLLSYDFSDFGDNIFYGTVYASGKVDLHGRPGEVTINCEATPLEGTTFTYDASSTDAISSQDFITWREVSPTPSKRGQAFTEPGSSSGSPLSEGLEDTPTDIFINFAINATPQAEMRLLMDSKTNDYITLYGSGAIQAKFHNKGAFHMFGTYTVSSGTYGITIQNIIKKNFTFQNGGTIVFGGNPMEANLNLQALYTVSSVSLSDLNIGNSFTNNTIRVNCLMNIQGQAGSPRLDFDLDMPNVNSEERQMIRSIIASEQETNQQVIYLLSIGRFYTQGVNNANSQQEYGQTELAMQSFLSGTLSTQLNEVISQVINNNNWSFGTNISTGTEGWHNAEYEGLISGRVLNNRLVINGQFGYRDNAKQATPSFIGDFDIRYLLQPNGNLALKVYNQTNDRYFTHSSLNTQGIGLIIKRDFNTFGEMFRKRKKQ